MTKLTKIHQLQRVEVTLALKQRGLASQAAGRMPTAEIYDLSAIPERKLHAPKATQRVVRKTVQPKAPRMSKHQKREDAFAQRLARLN